MSAGEPEAEEEVRLDGTNYRATRVLGRGGMGVGVEAIHKELGKRFAVKLLSPPGGAPVTHFEEDRLRVEAQALANIESPHVVSVHHIGRTSAGKLYVAMDLLDGQSLAAELAERGRFPVRDAMLIARDALAGLHAAHKLGVVHRDIKPANLFLAHQPDSPRGHVVKVLDFGVAKITEVAQRHGIDAPVIPTQDGYFMGTPRYFSPEHVTYGPFDARTDLYGIGLVLYVTLTGRGPFDEEKGLSAFALAAATSVPPPPSRFAPDRVDAALDALVLRALEKRPQDRYPDARSFINAIDSYLASIEEPAPAPKAPEVAAEQPRSSRRVVATELIEEPSRVVADPMAWAPTVPLDPPAVVDAASSPKARPARPRRAKQRGEPFRARPFVIALLVTMAVVALAFFALRFALSPG